MNPLNTIISLCQAFVRLMDPLVEVVIHDTQSNKICFIEGSLSKRSIGDSSLLDSEQINQKIDEIIYPKISFDGRLVQSISVLLEDRWLVCLNVDASIFHEMEKISRLFLKSTKQKRPEALFKHDWQENLHLAIHSFLQEKAWPFENLKIAQKKELVHHLYTIGAFREKRAVDYISKIVGLGRATIFKYLKNWKQP